MTFTGIASGTEGVHGECHCLVSLFGEGTETHRTKKPEKIEVTDHINGLQEKVTTNAAESK